MPKLVDLVEVAEALESKAVFLASDRCVKVRNRNSSCTKCSDACPVDAVEASKNILKLDEKRCVACGACTVVCPTEALIPLQPLDEDLSSAITSAFDEANNSAIFACARIASKRTGNPSLFAEVPCLSRIEEGVILTAVAEGAEKIVLVDGTCSTCKFRSNVAGIEATVLSAQELLAAQGCRVEISRTSQFPEEVLIQDRQDLLAKSRRSFFSGAGSRTREAAVVAADVMVFKKEKAAQLSLRERFRLSDGGTLPQFNPERRMKILDAMDALGNPVAKSINTRLFGSVSIKEDICTSCNMCTVFCPTGALKKSDRELAPEEGSYLEFSVADCVQCRLCEDSCPKDCLTVDDSINLTELFDFEPRFIYRPKPPARKGILSRLKKQ